MSFDGLLLLDKPPGCTSHDAVQRARRILRQKRIGHCGTLDPDATGLLLLTLGQATRLTRFLIHAPKTYEGTIRFGIATDTYDASGRVVAEAPIDDLTSGRIDDALCRFQGTFEQQLPAYSARKVRGVKLYELARRGEEIPESSKQVTVYELARTSELDDGRITFRLACSSGTYARAIAHELGAAVGCGAHLESLRRTEVGPFAIPQAVTLDELEHRRQEGAEIGAAWLELGAIPLPFPATVIDAAQERRARHGQTVLVKALDAAEGDWVKMAGRRGELIAVGNVVERVGAGALIVVQPRIVFPAGTL